MQIVIELDRGASTVSGRLTAGDEPERPFFGWLELIDSFERLREAHGADAGGRGDAHGAEGRETSRGR